MFDYHGKGSHPIIDLNVRLDHTRVFERKSIVDIDVASQLQFRIPYLHDGNFGGRYADDPLHSVSKSVSSSLPT